MTFAETEQLAGDFPFSTAQMLEELIGIIYLKFGSKTAQSELEWVNDLVLCGPIQNWDSFFSLLKPIDLHSLGSALKIWSNLRYEERALILSVFNQLLPVPDIASNNFSRTLLFCRFFVEEFVLIINKHILLH